MDSQGGLSLSKRDLLKADVAESYLRGDLSRDLAAKKVSRSERSMTRLASKVRKEGVAGVRHGNRGCSPANKTPSVVRDWYLTCYQERLGGFNLKHAWQYMREFHSPPKQVCYSTFLGWANKAGLGQVKKTRRTSKARIARNRMANVGLMVQMDGSPHRWNGDDKWTMITIIDDASSKILSAKFAHSETTWDCMDVLKDVIAKYGIPEFVLTDQAGWADRTGKRAHFSQFKRACEELGITVIATSVPETKGRVERSFRTAQDRLISELRYHGIKVMADANRYLQQVYIPDWERRFSVEPASGTTRFKPVPAGVDLNEILCIKYFRKVNRNHTVSFGSDTYRLIRPPQNLWRREVAVHLDREERVKIFFAGTELASEICEKPRLWRKNG